MVEAVRQAESEFLDVLTLLDSHVQLVQTLYGHRSPSLSGVLSESDLYNQNLFLQKVMATVDRRTENVTACGGVVLLTAVFEEFVRAIVVRGLRELVARSGEFHRLSERLRLEQLRLVGRILQSLKPGDIGSIELLRVCGNLHTSLSGGKTYTLDYDSLSRNYRNLKSAELTELYSRIGCEGIWLRLAGCEGLRSRYGSTDNDFVSQSAIAELNELMDFRNHVAHAGGFLSGWGADKLLRSIEFIRVLAAAIAGETIKFVEEQKFEETA